MPSNRISRALVLSGAVAAALAIPAYAGSPVKVAFINLPVIKQKFPDAANVEALRMEAENQLHAAVMRGNERIQQAMKDKKSDKEITDLKHDIQTEINGMQNGIQSVVGNQSLSVNQRIFGTAQQVAREKNYDLVVDGTAMIATKDHIVDPADEITEAVLERLKNPPRGEPKPPASK